MRPQNGYALAVYQYSKCILLGMFIALQGCTVTNIQQVDVEASPIQHPIRVTEKQGDGELFARGYLSMSQEDLLETQVAGHTDVNRNGIFELEPTGERNRYLERAGVNEERFRGDNFAWNSSQWLGGLELEWQPSRALALVGGLGFSEIDDKTQITQNLGVGLLFGSETVAARLDFGVSFYQSRFRIQAVQGHNDSFSGDMTRVIEFLEVEDTDEYNNATVGLTLNTRHTDRPINYFFNYTAGRQTFYDVREEFFFLEAGQQQRIDFRYSEGYNAFSTGLFASMQNGNRFVIGGRFTKYNDEMDQLSFFNFFAQYDIRLF